MKNWYNSFVKNFFISILLTQFCDATSHLINLIKRHGGLEWKYLFDEKMPDSLGSLVL